MTVLDPAAAAQAAADSLERGILTTFVITMTVLLALLGIAITAG